MKEIRHLKTITNKRNLNTKWLLLQNDQNADTTLLHSHDELWLLLLSVTNSNYGYYCYLLLIAIMNSIAFY